ncbi:(2,3-dihydroxybenzoyl)adenylate synthase [Streptomyces sp. NPDC051776]|uniref:(2,3-dihydroxybenzoyl)adenylate synthase n=1 Tax=Streptomyces sp. NPDC051776 TaxID=3155414 RepID=UPI00341B3C56
MTSTHPGWPDATARQYRRAGYWRGQTFGSYLRQWAALRPHRTALVDGDRRWTYAQLDDGADRLASGLRGIGISRGDRVVIQLPNQAEFPLVWFALQRLGAVPVHAMPAHRSSEIRHLIRTSGAVAYVIPDRHLRCDYRELAREMLHDQTGEPGERTLTTVVVAGDPGSFAGFIALSDLMDSPEPTPGTTQVHRAATTAGDPHNGGAAPCDLALLLVSGGTTGLPKLIPRTHDDYAYNARAAAEAGGLGEDSVYLAVLPIAFNFTLACPGMLGTFMAGGTVVLSTDPSPQTAFRLIEREGVTLTSITPPLVPHWLQEHLDQGGHALTTLRVLQVGGARLSDHRARALGPALGTRVQQVFGMAEGLINVTGLDDPEDLICSTQGRPISPADEIRVVGPDDRPVPDGEPGELLTRGPYTLRGYYRAEEYNAKVFTADGFFRTGDIVRRLPSGHLVVVGRVKDQINRGGEKFAATEVEDHLLTHPAITAVALVAAPDAARGERSVAFVTCPDKEPSTRELASFLGRRGLAAYKFPDQVVRVDAFPMTAVGKIDKKQLVGLAQGV